MPDDLDRLCAWGVLRSVDVHLARSLVRRTAFEGPPAALAALAAAFALHSHAEGHAYFDLALHGAREVPDPDGGPACVLPGAEAWAEAVAASPLCPGPLVLERGTRLYLQRSWDDEQTVARALAQRMASPAEAVAGREGVADELLGAWYPAQNAGPQRAAARLALERRLAIVTGGPGTGKTTALAALLGLAASLPGPGRRIGLAAPTGKGAHRAQSALLAARAHPALTPEGAARLPEAAHTLHRLLGARRAGGYRYGREQRLPLDLLCVDEASMVDLAMMRQILEALPGRATLVLLGDPDQLAPVEAGAVLQELCRAGMARGQRVHFVQRHRFGANESLVTLADAIRAGDADGVLACLRGRGSVSLHELPPDPGWTGAEAVVQAALAGQAAFHRAARGGGGALAALDRFQLLSPFRHGPLGSAHLNELIEARLAPGGAGPGERSGQPVIVVRNDYEAGLFNGDVGVVHGAGRVEFPGQSLFAARLPACELAHALTVHKAQGSEYDRVMLVLPRRERRAAEPAATRQLLYTAVTRAREAVSVWADEATLRAAVEAPGERTSALAEQLDRLG